VAGQRNLAPQVDYNSAAFMRGLEQAVHRMGLRTEADLARVGMRVQNAARGYCPVDTGRLRSSITSTPGKDHLGPYVEIGTNVEYAAPVEFGTSTMEAQPFLRPAFADAAGFVRQET
jgi:HK97 gp10 family phage protein